MKRKSPAVNNNPDPNHDSIQPKTSSHEERKKIGSLYVGCAGFANAGWVGNFYPRTLVGSDSSRQLDFYQQHFTTVEINSTFYGIPSESTVQRWKEHSAPSFRVVLKTPKIVTHEHNRLNAANFAIFLERAMILGDNLFVILMQCPHFIRVDVTQVQEIDTVIRAAGYSGRIALEIRNTESMSDAILMDKLRVLHNWSCVYHPNSLGRATAGNSQSSSSIEQQSSSSSSSSLSRYGLQDLQDMCISLTPPITADFVYVRLHGDNDRHAYEYTSAELARVADQIHKWRISGLDVYVMMLNEMKPGTRTADGVPSSSSSLLDRKKNGWSAMPKNASDLQRQVYALINEVPPPPPKRPPKTLTNFFVVKKKKR